MPYNIIAWLRGVTQLSGVAQAGTAFLRCSIVSIVDIIAGPVLKIIDKVIPDPQAKAQAQMELIRLQQAGEFKQIDADLQYALAQTDINKVEAGSTDWVVARWRPFIGWICGAGLGVQFLVGPLFTWGAALTGHPIAFPSLDMGTLLTLLLGMLGLGGMRTMEKMKGVA